MTELWDHPSSRYETSRNHLHQLAFFALSPARYREVGRMGLTSTSRGFGTPPFAGNVARVERDQLIWESGGNLATQTITTVRAAATFFGGEYRSVWFEDFHDPLSPVDPDAALEVDADASLLIGEWFRFGFDALNDLRSRGNDSDDVSEVQLWPEHFDAATELGSQEAGQRASYGASPGDASIPHPYLYVAPWSGVDKSDEYWNAEHFGGSALRYEVLAAAADPGVVAAEFFWEGYQRLHR